MADMARIKRNVANMAAQNAPIDDIDGYIASEGVTVDDVRNFKPDTQTAGSAQGARQPRHLSFEEGQALLDTEGVTGGVGAALTGAADGIPIAGPAILGATKRAAAGVSSLINGKSYNENLQRAQDLTSAAQEQHPYMTTAGNVTGAVGGTIPMVMAAPGAFGAGAGNVFLRGLAAGASGAGIGGTDAAVRSGGDPSEIEDGIMWGLGTGAVGPFVGKAVGAGARWLMDMPAAKSAAKAAGTKASTVAKLAKSIAGDGLDEAAVRQRLADLGPKGMIADLGPNTQGQAAALAAIPGRGQEIMRSALDARQAGANGRLAGAVDKAMGQSVIPSAVDAEIKAGQRSLGPAYDEAFRNARAVDTTKIAESLESNAVNLRGKAQDAVRSVRSMLDIAGTNVLDPNPGTLHQTRQAIDGMLRSETDGNVIRALKDARQQIDDELTTAVPGIKDADAAYAELSRQREALERGQTVLSHGRDAPRPSELAEEVQRGALPQGTQIGPSAVPLRLSQGARAEVDRILGSNANDISALNRVIKTEGDWNRDRLATLFGPQRADELFRVLDNELTFARTRDAVTRNSETARRQQHIADIGGSGEPDFARNAFAAGGTSGLVRAGGIKAVDKLLNSILGGQREAANTSLAQAMISNRDALVDAIARRQGLPRNSPVVEAITKAILIGGGATGP